MSEEFEEITEEEIKAINEGYFICPKCGELAEKVHILNGVMCSQCGAWRTE